MAFPVLDESAEVVYHNPHNKMKRKLDCDGVVVNDGRPVVKDRADRRLANGRYRDTRLGSSASADVNFVEIFCAHGLSLVHTGLNIGSLPACIPHPNSEGRPPSLKREL